MHTLYFCEIDDINIFLKRTRSYLINDLVDIIVIVAIEVI